MPQGIVILGLNGSGKSTLTRAVAQRLGFRALDVEDYFFLPSDIPFSRPRSREECYAALWEDIRTGGDYVLAHVRGDCGEQVNATYAMAVLLTVPAPVRQERIRRRALERFGERVLPGGDMYEQEEAFFRMAASRSEEDLEPFLQRLSIPILRLDGTGPVALLADRVAAAYEKNFPSKG